jgi:hypothetical protein
LHARLFDPVDSSLSEGARNSVNCSLELADFFILRYSALIRGSDFLLLLLVLLHCTQRHRREFVVAHALNFSRIVEDDEFRIHYGYLSEIRDKLATV